MESHKKTATMFQRLNAGHDTNGNPRRVFVLLDYNGDIVHTIDEGFSGTPKECKGLLELPSLDISAGLYRKLLRDYWEGDAQ